jgi:uncharacterized damage-inducible protein DinB
MSLTDAFLREFDNEAGLTRRVLERVPDDKLSWRPHPKSMSLGELAFHVAASPGVIAGWCTQAETSFTGKKAPSPTSTAQILAAHDAGVQCVKDSLTKVGDDGMKDMWTAKAGGATLMTMPKQALTRTLVLNHLIHHRGQLSVYLRLIDVPVPPIYGPSADENPFAART